MGLKKGQTNNPGGRPAGSQNKINSELRQSINDFLQKNFAKVEKDMAKLSRKDRIKAYTDLLQYGLPKLQSTSLEIDYENMSDEQLNFIVESLKQQASHEQK